MKTVSTILQCAVIAILPALMVGCNSPGEPNIQPSRESLSAPNGNVVDLEPTPIGNSNAAFPTPNDNFWNEAAAGGMAEVELSRLAIEKAQDPAVKRFAQRMVTDHTKANEELKALAARKNITLPTTLDARHAATKQRLQNLSGDEFDRAYVDAMVRDHEAAVQLFESQAQDATDSDVKAFVDKTLPTIRQHLEMIRTIDSNMR